MEKKYAALYIRVSTKYQAEEGVSLDVQKEETEHEAKRYGYDVFDTFTDEGISGSFTKRDRLQDLIDIVKTQDENNRIIDAIIVYDLSRLSRSIKHTLDMFKLFDRQKVKLISIKDGLTGENDAISRKIITTVLSLLNELYIDQLRIKVPSGMKKSLIENRRWQGGQIPYGYDLLPEKDENGNYIYETSGGRKRIVKKLYINEYEADVIRIIFHKAAFEDWGAYKIVKFLNENEYRTKKNSIFRTKFLLDVIHNKLYRAYSEDSQFGTLTWGRIYKKIEDDETGKYTQHFRKEPLVDEVEGIHEAIVDKKTWELANEAVKKRADSISINSHFYVDKDGFKRRKKTNVHLFTTILKCPKCGGQMNGNYQTRKTQKEGKVREVYYKCFNWFQSGICSPNSLKEDNIIGLIMPYFYKGFDWYYSTIQRLKDEGADFKGNTKLEQLEEQLETLKKNKATMERQIKTLINSIANVKDENIKERYEKVIQEKNEQQLRLDEKIDKTQGLLAIEEKKIVDIKAQLSEFSKISDSELYFNSLNRELQKELINKVIKRIVVDKPSFKTYKLKDIEYNYEEIEDVAKTMGLSHADLDKVEGVYDKFSTFENIEDLMHELASVLIDRYRKNASINTLRANINHEVDMFIFHNKIKPLEIENHQAYKEVMKILNGLESGNEEVIQFMEHMKNKAPERESSYLFNTEDRKIIIDTWINEAEQQTN